MRIEHFGVEFQINSPGLVLSLELHRRQLEMYYQSDFQTFPVRFQSRYDNRRNVGEKRKSRVKIHVVAPSVKTAKSQSEVKERPNFVQKWFTNLCENTSVHGLKYIGQAGVHWTERFEYALMSTFRSISAFL